MKKPGYANKPQCHYFPQFVENRQRRQQAQLIVSIIQDKRTADSAVDAYNKIGHELLVVPACVRESFTVQLLFNHACYND